MYEYRIPECIHPPSFLLLDIYRKHSSSCQPIRDAGHLWDGCSTALRGATDWKAATVRLSVTRPPQPTPSLSSSLSSSLPPLVTSLPSAVLRTLTCEPTARTSALSSVERVGQERPRPLSWCCSTLLPSTSRPIRFQSRCDVAIIILCT